MKITICCVGKIKEKYFTDAVAEYAKRLSGYCTFEVQEVADEMTPDHASDALNEQIKEKVHLSFSDMTFPHQLMRVILSEQIYRAFRIMNHEPYHK